MDTSRWGAVKRLVWQRVPALAAALSDFRRWLNRDGRSPRVTSLGFRFAGDRRVQAGTFERAETAFVLRELAAVDAFVDIGAHAGFYTCLARHAGREAVAIEPHPANCRLLCANLVANGWSDTEVFPLALGLRPGIATLYGTDSCASLITGWGGGPTARQQHAAVSTLDIVLRDRFPGRKLLIKVDVEGSEYAVLQGSVRSLQSTPAPTWLVEVCLTEHHPGGINPHYVDVFEIFWKHGYRASTVEVPERAIGREEVCEWVRSRRRAFGSYNVVFRKGPDSPRPSGG